LLTHLIAQSAGGPSEFLGKPNVFGTQHRGIADIKADQESCSTCNDLDHRYIADAPIQPHLHALSQVDADLQKRDGLNVGATAYQIRGCHDVLSLRIVVTSRYFSQSCRQESKLLGTLANWQSALSPNTSPPAYALACQIAAGPLLPRELLRPHAGGPDSAARNTRHTAIPRLPNGAGTAPLPPETGPIHGSTRRQSPWHLATLCLLDQFGDVALTPSRCEQDIIAPPI
jgi:hypothetical protein